MDNTIIVPLSGVLGAAAKTVTNWDIAAYTALAAGDKTASADTGALDSTTDGDGSGAKFTFVTDGSKALTISGTGFVAGKGYKVGDTITVELASGTGTSFVQDSGDPIFVTLLVTEAVLLGGEDNAIITCPAGGYLVCVEPGVTSDYKPIIRQIEPNHSRKWEFTLTGADGNNYEAIALAINNALMEALQNPSSNPVLDLPSKVSGVGVTKVVLD